MNARRFVLLGLAAAALATGPAASAGPAPRQVAFVGWTDGPLALTTEEVFVGVNAAFAANAGLVELTRDAPKKPHAWEELFAALDRRGVVIALAFVEDSETALVEKAAEKAKLPLLVLSHAETQPDLDPHRAVFWAGGLHPTDEALYAMDFLLQPLSVQFPAIFHDGSPRAVTAASKCARMCHMNQTPKAPQKLPEVFGAVEAAKIAGMDAPAGMGAAKEAPIGEALQGRADGFLYFGGPAGAERLVAACAAAKVEVPVLLSQGGATRAVPTFSSGAATTAWALEPVYFEDYVDGKGSPAPADAPALEAAAKQTGGHLYPATIRGWRAATWVMDAIRIAPEMEEKRADRKFLAAMRAINRNQARGKFVFENWGHACLVRTEGWRSAPERDEPACTRVRPSYMPMSCLPQVGFFAPDRFAWEPNSVYVWMHWGSPEERTIDKDLNKLGLSTGGYEQALEARIIDDLMARTISRMNRLYLRNADGTAIPGISFNVTFGTEKEPKGLKPGNRFEAVLRGDTTLESGGVAHGNTCEIFTTYIQRTMYAKDSLTPPIGVNDRQYVTGAYKWGSSLKQNLRGDGIRALCDGYTQALSMTGAHEAGHMFGLGHDTTSRRSLMNVVDAVGLDFDWAEWIPANLKTLENRLGRVPAIGEKPK